MSKKDKVITGIIVIGIAGVLFFCGFKIYQIYWEYKDGSDVYEEIEEYINIPEDPEETVGEAEDEDSEYIDFSKLQEMYPDIVGWIQIPELGISYPILQGKNNSFYLNHLPTGEAGRCGSIFLDCNNDPNFGDTNSIVYGHHMKDGTMFAALKHYKELSQTTYLYVYTPYDVLQYQVISAYQGSTANRAYTYYFPEEKDVLEFHKFVLGKTEIRTVVESSLEDKFITLSTCDNQSNSGRFIIHGKLNW
ncbi:MAG: class B sortase [Brevinema sp.]